MKKGIASGLLLLLSSTSHAWETDNSLAWGYPLQDSTDILNQHFNGKITENLKRSRSNKCEDLVFSLGLSIMGGVSKNTHDYVRKNSDIDQVPFFRTPMKEYVRQSIYRDSKNIKDMSAVINANGVYIGADKLAHAFGMGLILYLHFRSDLKKNLKQYPLEQAEALAWEKVSERSIDSEKGFCGLSNSEVFSYADTEANYQGARFYQSLCTGDSPRIQRGKTGWELVRPLDLREYISPWWDESFYPNYYTEAQGKKVNARLSERCIDLYSSQMKKQRAHYATFTQESMNARFMRKAIEQGEAPDPKIYSIAAVCGDI
jgi:hypothetical protein